MGATNEILRYVGGTAGPAGDGWVVVLNGDLWVDKTSVLSQSMLGNLAVPQLSSTVASGTPPFIVTSPTVVPNLNADLLDGQQGAHYLDLVNATGTLANARLPTAISVAGNMQGSQLVSTIASGTPPIVVTSPTMVPNLNADTVDGIQGASIVTKTGNHAMAGALTIGPFAGASSGLILPVSSGATERSSLIMGDYELGTDPLGTGDGNKFYVYKGGTGAASILHLTTSTAVWFGNTEFLLQGAVGDNPSQRFHWNGLGHYMDWLGGTNHPLYFRAGGTIQINMALDNTQNVFYLNNVFRKDHAGLITWSNLQVQIQSQAAGTGGSAGMSFWASGNGVAPVLGTFNAAGERLWVRNNPNTAFAPIAASAFEVNSALSAKTNVRRRTPTARKSSRERMRRLRTVEFDDAVPPQSVRRKPEFASVPDDEVTTDMVESHAHNCAIDQCGGTANQPCGVWRAGRNRRSVILEELAEQFPEVVIADANGVDYAYDLVGLMAELLDTVLDMDAELQERRGAP
jgi:hypothetical protein